VADDIVFDDEIEIQVINFYSELACFIVIPATSGILPSIVRGKRGIHSRVTMQLYSCLLRGPDVAGMTNVFYWSIWNKT
jgi:hypothetical protein